MDFAGCNSPEYLARPEARQALRDLAKGLPHARLTREAKAALERLANSRTTSP